MRNWRIPAKKYPAGATNPRLRYKSDQLKQQTTDLETWEAAALVGEIPHKILKSTHWIFDFQRSHIRSGSAAFGRVPIFLATTGGSGAFIVKGNGSGSSQTVVAAACTTHFKRFFPSFLRSLVQVMFVGAVYDRAVFIESRKYARS